MNSENKNYYHCILLHSNDIHADFESHEKDGRQVGGISRLSGYIKQARTEVEKEAFLYTISGDLFRGSLIDSEYLGMSTVALANYLQPDAACFGNHEIDYGISHSLLLEKVAAFPVICSNIYLKFFNRRLYQPYYIHEMGGSRILFIGVLTESVIKQMLNDRSIGNMIEVRDPAEEIKKVMEELKGERIDSVYLLSHIGLEEDIELAKRLDPSITIHGILGGHSHTFMEQPVIVNGIPIVQAGWGTGQIGRFDIYFDLDTGKLANYEWRTVEINEETSPADPEVEALVQKLKQQVDAVYNVPVCRFDRKATNPARNRATDLNQLYADSLAEAYSLDVAFVNSGSVRVEELGPTVTRRQLKEAYPYNEEYYMATTDLEHLKKLLAGFYKKDYIWSSPHTSVLVPSKALQFTWDAEKQEFTRFLWKGKEAPEDTLITLGLNQFLHNAAADLFGGTIEELTGCQTRVIAQHSTDDVMALLETKKEVLVLPPVDRLSIV